jgi:hypothetical protein
MLLVLCLTWMLLGIPLFTPGTAFAATTYYVSTTGSDSTGTGTSANPWGTLAYAANQVAGGQGHTIHLKAGTYNETQITYLKQGTNLEGEGTGNTVVKGTLADGIIQLSNTTATNGNQTLSNFKIDGNNRQLNGGIKIVNRSGVVINNIAISLTEDYGIQASSDTGLLSGIEIKNSTFTNASNDYSTWSNAVIYLTNTTGALIHHNTITTDKGYGIKAVGENIQTKGMQIYNNTITVTGTNPTWGSNCTIELWYVSDDTEIYNNTLNSWVSLVHGTKGAGSKSVTVHDNQIIRDNGYNGWGVEINSIADADFYSNYIHNATIGFELHSEASNVSNILIRNNVVTNANNADGYASGVMAYSSGQGNISGLKIYNNVIDGSPFTGVLLQSSGSGKTITGTEIKNNIMKDTASVLTLLAEGGGTIGTTTLTYNHLSGHNSTISYWSGTQDMSKITGTTNSNNLTGTPGIKASGSKPVPYYEPANVSSAVVNAGTNVGLTFNGAAPDIGAYEYAPPSSLTLQAESYNAMSGINNYGGAIGGADNGDWVRFDNVNFGTGYVTFTARLGVPAAFAGQQVEVRLGSVTGTLCGTLITTSTGDWSTYTDQSISLTGAMGTNTVYLVFKGSSGVGNFDWFKFT